MTRLPRDVSVHLFRRAADGPAFLMLRRRPARGGFWQRVSGAPLPGETDAQAAVREVLEETGCDVSGGLFPLGVHYAYALRPGQAARWEELYGPGVESVSVVSFGAELPAGDPILDPREHTPSPGARTRRRMRCSTGRSRRTPSPGDGRRCGP